MSNAMSIVRDCLDKGELGPLTYARFSRHHQNVNLGLDVSALLATATMCMGKITSIQARGQWIGEAGALTLVLEHDNNAMSLIDLSSASIRVDATPETLLRIEGANATVEILPGSICRISGQGWRREETVGPLELPVGDNEETQNLVDRAMQAAEHGDVR